MAYLYMTYMMELAEKAGVLVINKPSSLRDANEKLFTSWFPSLCPPTLVTQNPQHIQTFIDQNQTIILIH